MDNKNEPLEVVRDERIALALPVFSQAYVPFVQCLIESLSRLDIIGMVDFLPGDSLVNRARNVLAHHFVEGYPDTRDGKRVRVQYDWLLFLDTDLVFRPEAITMIYELALSRGTGIYAGTYPMKQIKPKVVYNPMPGCRPDSTGVVEVREAGTGFMLIHREVFAQMREKFADEIRYEADMGAQEGPRSIMYDYFSVGVRYDPLAKYKRFLSEDWYFCQRWREIGGKIFMQTNISCSHIGNFMFPGKPEEIIEAGRIMEKGMEIAKAEREKSQPVLVKTVKAAA
jgi:hypothetical protein